MAHELNVNARVDLDQLREQRRKLNELVVTEPTQQETVASLISLLDGLLACAVTSAADHSTLPERPTGRVLATFRPEAWVNNYAVEIDGSYQFDIADQLAAMPPEQARAIADGSDESDALWEHHPVSRARPHHGPFTVLAADAIREHLDMQRRRELGYDDGLRLRTDGRYEVEVTDEANARYGCLNDQNCILATGHPSGCSDDREAA